MAINISRVQYFYCNVRDRPGEAHSPNRSRDAVEENAHRPLSEIAPTVEVIAVATDLEGTAHRIDASLRCKM